MFVNSEQDQQKERQLIFDRLGELEPLAPSDFNRRRAEMVRNLAARHLSKIIDEDVLGITPP